MNTPADTPDSASAHPVLAIDEAKRFEAALFGGDETLEWPAMQQAGRAIADAVLRDFCEIGGFPNEARILVLAGKGHNGGDALLAAKCILEKHPCAQASVCLVFGERALRPLALRAWRELVHAAPERVIPWSAAAEVAKRPATPLSHEKRAHASLKTLKAVSPLRSATALQGAGVFDLCIDGVFGFQFRPPIDAKTAALIENINALTIRLRAAVDLPSGLGGAPVLRADFTYATGIVKSPVLESENAAVCGRVRYLDLGMACGDLSPLSTKCFSISPPSKGGLKSAKQSGDKSPHAMRILTLTAAILSPLRTLRSPQTDKRDYGHLFIIGGSRKYPGAIIMSVLAALRSGAGLVTAFVPESLAPACAAQIPEAIWCGLAESPDGGLALEDFTILRERLSETKNSTGRATALLIGPGLSRDREARTLALDVMRLVNDLPIVLDADALQPDIVTAGKAPRILTPHAGEYERIAPAIAPGAVIVRKGPLTSIERGAEKFVSPFGGPVLARGGSGDLLAGLIGGLLAQSPEEPLLAACRGTVWHGMAADCLARAHGQRAVRITQLPDFLPEVFCSAGFQPASLSTRI